MNEVQGNDLTLAYWINRHFELLRKIGYGTLIAIVALIWLMLLIQTWNWVSGIQSAKRALDPNSQPSLIYDTITQPTEPTFVQAMALDSGEQHVTALALFNNPNPKHVVRFDAVLQVDGTSYTFKGVFIPAGQQRYILQRNIASTNIEASSISATISNIEYLREPIRMPALSFNAKDPVFSPVDIAVANVVNNAAEDKPFLTPDDVAALEAAQQTDSATTTNAPYSVASAIIQNNSAYGFRSMQVVALLKNQAGAIVGADTISMRNIDSFTEQPIAFFWKRRFTIDVKPEILFYVDYLDTENLILPTDS